MLSLYELVAHLLLFQMVRNAQDTVIVDPMRGMEIEFVADNRGKWFHYCHNLYHMVAGMVNMVVYA